MKKFSFARSLLSRIALSTIFTICSSNAYSQNGLLLNCELKDGYPNIQIYINEAKRYVIYNAQVLGNNYERKHVFKRDSGETQEIDIGMDITINNDALILANDDSASFVFIKETLTFAYAWTTPVPLKDGKFLAFGNHTEGKCSVNPFSRPDK